MRRPTLRQIAIPLVVLMVALAGCSGGGGGDGGDASPTATVTDDGGAEMTSTPTATDGGGDTQTTTQTATTTAGDTPTATSTSDPGTSTPGSSDGFSPQRHATGLQNAGSYTIEYTIDGFLGGGGGSDSSNTVIKGVEKVELDTGERYASVTSSGGDQEFTLEYYQPPDSDTIYQHVAGQTRETTQSQALLFNFASLNSSGVETLPNLRNAGTAQTSLGPATKYVVDSVDQLPDATREQYGSIESVSFVLFVDKDTGVIAKYDYRLTYVQDGEETSVQFVIELTDLGSTTVEAPEWAP